MNLKNLIRLLLIILIFISTSGFSSQENLISINIRNKSIKKFLSTIETQTDYRFVYSNSEIDVDKKISYKAKRKELHLILTEVLTNEGIYYQIIGKQILLKRKQSSENIVSYLKIEGKVFARKDSVPLPGVNIFSSESGIGTTSDVNGNFSLNIPKNTSLLASFMGYKTQMCNISTNKRINFYLEEDKKEIDEIVVIAYGQENNNMLSSSVSKVTGKSLRETQNHDLISSLKGKSTGTNINQNSGTPGGALSIRIRGISSITAGADPLYILDGVPLTAMDLSQVEFSGQGVNSISDINIFEIESVSILKDASATAIYGARGSNGVVLLTSKKGNSEESTIQFDAYYGIQMVSKTYDMLNAKQYMQYKNDASINDGGVAIYSQSDIENNTVDTDWQSELYRIAPVKNANLSFSGGSDQTLYFINLGYFNQDGIVPGTDYQKLNGRININHKISDKLKLGANIAIIKSSNNRKEGDQSLNSPVANAIAMAPIFPVYNRDGSYNDDGALANPISIANLHTNLTKNWHNLGNVFTEYKIFKKLNYKFKLGFDYISFKEHTYDPPTTRQGARYQGLGLESDSEVLKTMISNTLNYSTSINNHKIDILAGYETNNKQLSTSFMRGELFASEELEYLGSSVEKITADVYYRESAIRSFFGRIKFNLHNRYLASFNARYDGSSRFSDDNKYGFFPSGDIAWRLSEEPFFTIDLINELRIRASYGLTGNDQIPDFLYLSRFGTSEYDGSAAIYPINIPNTSLRWETTNQFNLGININLFNNRIKITADYYKKKTKDLLLEKPISPSSGFKGILSNIGKIENSGIEAEISSINLKNILWWESHINVSFNKNEVTQLYANQPIDGIGRGYQRIEVGEPIGFFYGYKALGVDPSTGNIVFEDLNKDGKIDIQDKTKIGSPHPIFQGGFSNILNYKNFSLNLFLQFSYGNEIFNGTQRYIESMKDKDNQTTAILDRWTQPGDITNIPKATNKDLNENNRVSSRYIEDGSYLKIKSLKLSYRLNENLTRRINSTKITIYLQAQNLFTFTNYSGMDPEVNYAGNDVIRNGVEFFTYPSARVFSSGLTIEF